MPVSSETFYIDLVMNKVDSSNGKWLDEKNGFFTTALYLKLHTEITLLASKLTGEMEISKDIASECLIALWQQEDKKVCMKAIKCDLIKMLDILYRKLCKQNNNIRLAEDAYIWQTEIQLPVSQTFRIAQRLELLDLSRMLEPAEHTVLLLSLFYELDPPEIGALLDKPVPTVKVIRDRATYQLKKMIVQKAASQNNRG